MSSCKTETQEQAEVPKTPDAPAAPAEPEKADPSCVGPITGGTAETIKLGEVEWELNGSTLKRKSPLKGDTLTIGALTDIKENTEENLSNLEAIVKWFGEKAVDLIVVAGDTGENRAQIEKALAVIATSNVPVLNIIGNREGKSDHRKAMVALRAKHGNIFDLNVVRRVDTQAADIISMPGYYNPSYIHTDDGCPYFEADLKELEELAGNCDSPAILVSHGGPRQEGKEAIDRTAEGANVGDPGLAKVIAAAKIPFGIFGNIHEAGGRATDLSGKIRLEKGKPHDALYLNPGPADGVRWGMNDGTESRGMAGLMTIAGGEASYEIYRIGDGKVAQRGNKQKRKKKGKKKK
ncbi:MAG: metallophosphoesterase [Myxococcota bacterium]